MNGKSKSDYGECPMQGADVVAAPSDWLSLSWLFGVEIIAIATTTAKVIKDEMNARRAAL